MEEKNTKAADLWSGAAFGALGAYIVGAAWQWEYLGPEGPGPGFFPLMYGFAMLGLSVVLIASSAMKKSAAASPFPWNRAGRALATWLALVISLAAYNVLGFTLSFALLAFFIVAAMYGRPLRTAAIVAVASAASFYLIFPLALGVSMPTGLLGF
jgi:putative tricarboxylic transport membrane protein